MADDFARRSAEIEACRKLPVDVAKRMGNALLVDGRTFLDPETVRAAGITYESIGRPSAAERAETGSSPVCGARTTPPRALWT